MMDLLPVVYTKLDKALITKAEKELRETEENLSKGLRQLRLLIEKESVICPKDDAYLTMFLRAKKFDVQKSFQQMKGYSESRPLHDKAYGFPEMDAVRRVLSSTFCGILPKRDQEGRVVIYLRVDQFDSDRFTGEDALRTMELLSHFVLQYPATQINGICYITNSKVNSFEHAQVLLKQLAKIFLSIRFFPARVKRVDNVNSNFLFRAAYSLMKKVSSRLVKRFTILGDEKEFLSKIYPPSILPEEFGGTLGSLRDLENDWMPEFEKYYMSKYKADSLYFLKGN